MNREQLNAQLDQMLTETLSPLKDHFDVVSEDDDVRLEYRHSEELDKRMQSMFKAQNRKRAFRKMATGLSATAAALLILITVLIGPAKTVAYAKKMLGFFIDDRKIYSSITFPDERQYWEFRYLQIEGIPDGFKEIEKRIGEVSADVLYENENKDRIRIQQTKNSWDIHIDTEGSTIYEKDIISIPICYYYNKGETHVYFGTRESFYIISSTLEVEWIFKLIEENYDRIISNSEGYEYMEFEYVPIEGIPEGFEVVFNEKGKQGSLIVYVNSSGEEIEIFQSKASTGNVLLDTEDAIVREKEIKGIDVFYYKNKGRNHIFFVHNNNFYSFITSLDEKFLFKLIEKNF